MSAPSVPLIVPRPRATDGRLEFWWQAPVSGAPITGYTLACPALSISNSYSGSVGYASVGSIPNKTDHTFTLTATNANGTGPAATFRTVQCGTVPYSNAVQTATASTISSSVALVSWTPSTTATQAQVKWYTIRAIPSNFPTTPSTIQSGFGTDTSRYIYNLSANTTYQFLVASINDVGWARPGLYTSSITTPAGQSPFFPTQISGLQIWLDATASSNFTFSSGSNISSWLDRSGKGQNTTNTAGTMTYSTINGTQSVVSPTNLNQMQCGTSTFSLSAQSTFSALGMINYTSGFGLANVLAWANNNDVRVYSHQNGSNTLGLSTNAQDFSLNYYVNGTSSDNASPKYVALNTPFQFFGINQAGGGTGSMTLSDLLFSRGFIGYYNEILFYSGAITTIQRQVLEGYLAWKWGREADLPLGHPYKDAAPTNGSPLS
jgi:hypothetical protein